MGDMSPDFSGYATKNGLLCSDGRTIRQGAFKHQNQTKVPLVWSHQHDGVRNVLGHALLEERADGVYAYGFFNETEDARHAKMMVMHGDIVALSIFANGLVEQSKNVMHGNIREVSLVLSGANPGALIDNVTLAHGDDLTTLADEAIIFTGLELSHSDSSEDVNNDEELEKESTTATVEESLEEVKPGDEEQKLQHADKSEGAAVADTKTDDKTVKDIFDAMSDEEKNVVYYMVGTAVETALEEADDDDDELKQSALDFYQNAIQHQEGAPMGRNVFEGDSSTGQGATLSHDQIKTIVQDAEKLGSFKESFLQHAATYGIENIDILFPEAKSESGVPDVIGRRVEWVKEVLGGAKKSPFARIKSTAVDLTADEARAKGYVKGNLKKDEIIKLLKRVTTPTTVYKKQRLDRDDIVDITDLDVVSWLKAEMRVMLDEELARAILIGDGREADDEDKIDTDHLRPIAYDSDMYAHQLNVASDLGAQQVTETILRARSFYKGTGTPTMFTTDAVLTDLILQKDKVGRRLYETEAALAAALRVSKIVTVEVMESAPEILAIIVNMVDYTIGADKGGNVSMFDDFDIDYNQYKYLIETRVSGTLTKPKSAVVVKRTIGTSVTPTMPSYDSATKTITFPTIEGVIYSVDGVDRTGDLVIDANTDVEARPAAGYSFPANTTREWYFAYTA